MNPGKTIVEQNNMCAVKHVEWGMTMFSDFVDVQLG